MEKAVFNVDEWYSKKINGEILFTSSKGNFRGL